MVDIVGNITKLFWDFFPWSLGILIVPIIIVFIFRGEKGDIIYNRVEVFFKGGTKAYYDCTPKKDTIEFEIDENEYSEPILHHPRIEYRKGKIFRTYLFAEGIGGTVEVPPLTEEDRDKIIKWGREYNILGKKKTKKYTDDELLNALKYYNFDIEQVLDKPMPKAFTTSINAFQHLVGGLIHDLKMLEGGTSNKYTFAVWFVGMVMGFFIAYSLTLKGVI